MIWKPVPSKSRVVGVYRVDYLRGDGPEGGHDVAFPDGRTLRVLPDGVTTGKFRGDTILAALDTISRVDGIVFRVEGPGFWDPMLYLIGAIARHGIDSWEILDHPALSAERVIADWAADWKGDGDASKLIAELEAAGYKIVEAG